MLKYYSDLGPENPQQKTKSGRLKAGRRQERILKHQHALEPFTHRCGVTFLCDITADEEKRFRRRLGSLNKGRFAIEWNRDRAKGKHRFHFHGVCRTDCTETEFKAFIANAFGDKRSPSKTARLRQLLDIHFAPIIEDKMPGWLKYQTSATDSTLERNELAPKGSRETFTTGKPFTAPKKELARKTPAEHLATAVFLASHDSDLVTISKLALSENRDLEHNYSSLNTEVNDGDQTRDLGHNLGSRRYVVGTH